MQADLESLRAFFRRSPFMVDLGVEPTAVSAGRITTKLPLALRHMQHTGQAHAGVMATLADHSMGAAAQTLAPAGHWALTAELTTSALRPGRGERLVCEAVVIKAGRRITFTEAEVFAELAGVRTLVMKASATMAIVPVQD
ncbi:MAG TPA: PaaI family thioesterase [Rubrivivax sp.]|nr:PaaI family thioesterase [Rubrivivax sp.]